MPALWTMEGFTSNQLAAKLGRAEPTVERKLRLIREAWAKEIGP